LEEEGKTEDSRRRRNSPNFDCVRREVREVEVKDGCILSTQGSFKKLIPCPATWSRMNLENGWGEWRGGEEFGEGG
jgi:hypothetical protein